VEATEPGEERTAAVAQKSAAECQQHKICRGMGPAERPGDAGLLFSRAESAWEAASAPTAQRKVGGQAGQQRQCGPIPWPTPRIASPEEEQVEDEEDEEETAAEEEIFC